MRITNISIFAWLIVLLLPSMVQAKEALPVSGAFTPDRVTAASGDVLEFSLEFSSTIKAGPWNIELEIPDGLLLLEGEKETRGDSLDTKQKYILHYKIKVLDAEEKWVWARLHYGDSDRTGITLSVAFHAVINESSHKDKSEIKTDKKGRKLRVLKVPTEK